MSHKSAKATPASSDLISVSPAGFYPQKTQPLTAPCQDLISGGASSYLCVLYIKYI